MFNWREARRLAGSTNRDGTDADRRQIGLPGNFRSGGDIVSGKKTWMKPLKRPMPLITGNTAVFLPPISILRV